MSVRIYRVLFIATLALLGFALIRPDVGMRVYDAVSRQIYIASTSTAEPTHIDTAPPATSAAPDSAVPSAATTVTIDVSGISFDVPATLEALSAGSESADPAPEELSSAPTGGANRLIIPRMGVDDRVIISDSPDSLNRGLWHIPGSAVPGSPGNVVIAAHRWLYKPPSPKTFYLIDKLEEGDPIIYEYGNRRYIYSVTQRFIVDPEDVQILSQDENKLTLFTCTPLYSTKQRYVINAELTATELLYEN